MGFWKKIAKYIAEFKESKFNTLPINNTIYKSREYQFEYVDFNIMCGELVLDIGSGHHPFPLATHLADLKTEDNSDRGGGLLVKDDRPFYPIDIEAMPFKNKEFDFVYCSHVLEHVIDPIAACSEIMRIGKRGYVETPTRASDMLYNYSYLHRWHVATAENTLIFVEYSDRERKGTGVDYFEKQQRNGYDNPVKKLIFNNRDLFYNMLMWDDSFNVHVFDKKGNHRQL